MYNLNVRDFFLLGHPFPMAQRSVRPWSSVTSSFACCPDGPCRTWTESSHCFVLLLFSYRYAFLSGIVVADRHGRSPDRYASFICIGGAPEPFRCYAHERWCRCVWCCFDTGSMARPFGRRVATRATTWPWTRLFVRRCAFACVEARTTRTDVGRWRLQVRRTTRRRCRVGAVFCTSRSRGRVWTNVHVVQTHVCYVGKDI